ncbi:hypothetical protein [Alcaligenes faecalis]|uniref:hypothetical protein n=1 Tax=Alcaligenes faecalis TaxID=511 RepID=UPI001EF060E2|nr:hypothetical protein [Alcaligenes faecalis]ULH05374.1 hypothetical protein MF263_11790 [Alcaligenes faecalis]
MSTETSKKAPVSAEPIAYKVPGGTAFAMGISRYQDASCFGGNKAELHAAAKKHEWKPLYTAPVAAQAQPYSLDLDPAGIRALTADAISGALALGFQGVNPPPNNEHWLASFWEIGRESAAQAQPLDIQPIEITDSMALAFHNAITDGAVGQEDVDDIKTGLRAVFANILDMRPQAQQPVSGADGLGVSVHDALDWYAQQVGDCRRFGPAEGVVLPTAIMLEAANRIDQHQRTLASIEAFVACDASAISYLSLGEYRTALLKMLRQALAGKDAGA